MQGSRMTPQQLSKCIKFTQKVYDFPFTDDFKKPVDKIVQEYYQKILEPMDLGTILDKLKNGQYKSVEQWKDDLKKVWDNAMQFNDSRTILFAIAKDLKEYCKPKMDAIARSESDQWKISLKNQTKKLVKLLDARPKSVHPRILLKSSH
ncbi:Bromodomain containing protein [Trichomonas vaginalis G3]|uniref:Bromodomain containing protein n=1 Tax=Trichomonas vaginalis (strain ATCC PRA-98 / G3) TaxID=412133 RepID=A2FM96_TRIV3|nr:bromodomain [Trichomonas vaginalis G3]EAX93952.1 Bromodomain containing protein [Trichomonas vaginalis G3]KAI5500917.1 bromodomain [Trichomonas vaginalis G3]|eukprot:XP_001306882.1 Bromodomain containing protein [Trichomonas vaginalis G3]